METSLTGIDHPVIGIRDMQAAHAVYQKLGFTIPPRGYHPKWGTGNWCIMFERDYLELRGVVDHEKGMQKMQSFFDQHNEGLMGIALSTTDAQASHDELAARGLHPQSVRELTRNFELPEGLAEPRFSLCFLDQAETPGLMSVVICQHQTPELLRRPEWLVHKNGTLRVISMSGLVPDLDLAEAAHAKIFGNESIQRETHGLTIQIGEQYQIQLTTPEQKAALYPELESVTDGTVPRLVAVTLQVEDLSATQKYFDQQQILTTSSQNAIVVMPEHTCGVVMRFQE